MATPGSAPAPAAKVTTATWSGDAYRKASWPAAPAKAYPSFAMGASGPSAEELAAAAAAVLARAGP